MKRCDFNELQRRNAWLRPRVREDYVMPPDTSDLLEIAREYCALIEALMAGDRRPLAALNGLVAEGKLEASRVSAAMADLGISADKTDPLTV